MEFKRSEVISNIPSILNLSLDIAIQILFLKLCSHMILTTQKVVLIMRWIQFDWSTHDQIWYLTIYLPMLENDGPLDG